MPCVLHLADWELSLALHLVLLRKGQSLISGGAGEASWYYGPSSLRLSLICCKPATVSGVSLERRLPRTAPELPVKSLHASVWLTILASVPRAGEMSVTVFDTDGIGIDGVVCLIELKAVSECISYWRSWVAGVLVYRVQ